MKAQILTVIICCPIVTTAHSEVQFQWSVVGNPGNVADSTGYGAVSNTFRISQHEVTNSQYTEFLNAVDPSGFNEYALYNIDMYGSLGGIEVNTGNPSGTKYIAKSGWENHPVNYISWYDAVRFTNWLHNGQGNGDTESGAYTLIDGKAVLGNPSATPINGLSITRNAGAYYFLPSEDEWYKAAYHNASAGTDGDYFQFATGTDSVPVSDKPGDNPAAVNYYNNDGIANGFNDGYAATGTSSLPARTSPFTDTGAYTNAESPYGTFDQNGNVWEWMESPIDSQRVIRGGSYDFVDVYLMTTYRQGFGPSYGIGNTGFRVAAPISGDFDRDGDIDNADIGVVAGNFTGSGGTGMTYAMGDIDGDGDVDNADIGAVAGSFTGAAAESTFSNTVVPEPTSLAPFGLGGLLLGRRRR